jgi:hypothetical protein
MEPNQTPINNPAPEQAAPQTPPVTQMPENLLNTPHKRPIVKIAVALIILIVLAVAAFLLLGNSTPEQAAVTEEQQLTEEDILGAELDATANIDSSAELNAIDAEF